MAGGMYVFGRAGLAAATAATCAAQLGRVDEAEEALAAVTGRVDAWVPEVAAALDLARAWVAAARGATTDARRVALGVASGLARTGARALELDALLAATRLGAAGEAAPRLGVLAGEVEGPLAGAAAHLARVLAARDGPGLDEAGELLAGCGQRIVAVEAHAAAAAAHGREGLRRRQAASRRRVAELVGDGPRPVTPLLAGVEHDDATRSLTAREREVALMAAAGASNREGAQALGLSIRTVNSHLNHAYVKLGTSDRSDLARILGREGGPR